MSYASELAAVKRTRVTLVVITMQTCDLVYGTSPCTPSAGSDHCYNTYRTCKDEVVGPLYKTNFDYGTKDYKFTSANCGLAIGGAKPYVQAVSILPQEIGSEITIRQRITIEMIDEPSSDIDVDPYWSDRSHATVSAVPGTYWKKFLARNPNYKDRTVKVYEGFLGLAEGDYVLKFVGKLESVKMDNGIVRFEAVDNLRFLENIYTHEKSFSNLYEAIDSTTTTVKITQTTGVLASGIMAIDDELIHYNSISGASTPYTLVTVTRGYYGTMRTNHDAGAKVQSVRHYEGNPFDVIEDIMIQSGLDYDSAALAEYSGNVAYTDEPDVAALVIKPIKLSDLFYELCELFALKTWINASGNITFRRDIFYGAVGYPQPTYITTQNAITDALNIIKGSCSIDWNEESRFTRYTTYYDLRTDVAYRALASGIDDTVTTIPVTSVEDLPSEGEVRIGDEFIQYAALDTTNIELDGCTRGARSTTNVAHSAGDYVLQTDLSVIDAPDDEGSYNRIDSQISQESENEYTVAAEKELFNRWFNTFATFAPLSYTFSDYTDYLAVIIPKLLARDADAHTRLSFQMEMKDSGEEVGDFIKITTDEFNDIDGIDLTNQTFQIIKEEPNESIINVVADRVISTD